MFWPGFSTLCDAVACTILFISTHNAYSINQSEFTQMNKYIQPAIAVNKVGNKLLILSNKWLYSNLGFQKRMLGYYPNSNAKTRGSNLDI